MKNSLLITSIYLLFTSVLIGQDALSVVVTNSSLADCNNGAIDLSIDGGIGLLTVEWIGSNGFYDIFYDVDVNNGNGQEDIENLENGKYTIIVTDALCRIAVLNDVVVACCELKLNETIIKPTFEKGCKNGMIDINITGSYPPYSVVWIDLTTNLVLSSANNIQGNNDGEDIDHLEPGHYQVIITDSYCGEVVKHYKVKCSCDDYCKINGVVTHVTCSKSGSINTTIPFLNKLPTNTFTFLWSNGSTDQNLSNISSGEYCLTVTDQRNGCGFVECWEVLNLGSEGPTISLLEKQNIPLCKSSIVNCIGALEIEVPPNATVEWEDLPNPDELFSTSVTGLCLGTYTVHAFLDGCESIATYSIECCNIIDAGNEVFAAEAIGVIETVNSTTNVDANNGSISLEVTSSFENVYFSWSGPNGFEANMEDIFNLVPGEYCVQIFDGCEEFNKCFNIYNCDEGNIQFNEVITNTCLGYSYGEISISPSGGYEQYEFLWNTGQTTAMITNLSAGTYCVTVTHSNNCEDISCFEIKSNVQQTQTGVTTPCGSQYFCHNNPTTFVPYDGLLNCGYESCQDYVCRCPVTQGVVSVNTDPYLGYVYDWSNCTRSGVCPSDGISVQFDAFGNFDVFTQLVQAGPSSGCSVCLICVHFETCEMDGQFLVLNATQVSLDLCPEPKPNDIEQNIYEDIISNMKISDLIGTIKRDKNSIFYGKDILLPTTITDDITVGAYNEILESFSSDSRLNIINESFRNGQIKFDNSSLIKVYPNPFESDLTLTFYSERLKEIKVEVYDILGIIKKKFCFNTIVGDNSIKLKTKEFQDGVYFVKVFTDTQEEVIKIVKDTRNK